MFAEPESRLKLVIQMFSSLVSVSVADEGVV
jgi:hypothetical protein